MPVIPDIRACSICPWDDQMPPRLPAVEPARLAQWSEEHLGSPPAGEIFRSGHLSAVIGLRLADRRAVVDQTASTTLGSSAWIVVGVAAVPSAALWAGLSRRWSRPTLLAVALGAQAAGIALPALISGTTAALASAVLFGATFLGVATVALATGAHLRTPRAVAILTTGYSVGQIAGPVLVTPMLHHSYRPALLAGAAIVAVAAVAALVLRHRFPHHLGPVPGRVRAAR